MHQLSFHENLQTLHVGTLPNHAYFIPHSSRESALTQCRTNSQRFAPLSGEWGQIVKSSATLGKELNRREPAEAFARAIVEEHFNFIQALPGNRPEIAAFWEEKAQQTIGIFVGTTFPWRRRMRKVNDCVELVRKFPMIGKL